LRPLTTGELLDGAIAVLRTRPGRLVGLGALLGVLEQLLLYPLRSLSDQDISLLPATGRLVEFGLLVIAGFATEAMIIATLATVAAGRSGRVLLGRFAPAVQPVRRAGAVAVVVMVGLVVAVTVAPFPVVLDGLQAAGFPVAWALAIVMWAVPYGLLGLAAPALVVEHRGPASALARSARLAAREGLRVVWIRVLAWASWALVRIGFVLAVVTLLAVISGGSLPSSTWDRIAISAALVIVNAVAYPVLGCLDTMLLLEGRMRTEGLDISLRWALRRGVAPSLEAPR
jgi:hypothetical protein